MQFRSPLRRQRTTRVAPRGVQAIIGEVVHLSGVQRGANGVESGIPRHVTSRETRQRALVVWHSHIVALAESDPDIVVDALVQSVAGAGVDVGRVIRYLVGQQSVGSRRLFGNENRRHGKGRIALARGGPVQKVVRRGAVGANHGDEVAQRRAVAKNLAWACIFVPIWRRVPWVFAGRDGLGCGPLRNGCICIELSARKGGNTSSHQPCRDQQVDKFETHLLGYPFALGEMKVKGCLSRWIWQRRGLGGWECDRKPTLQMELHGRSMQVLYGWFVAQNLISCHGAYLFPIWAQGATAMADPRVPTESVPDEPMRRPRAEASGPQGPEYFPSAAYGRQKGKMKKRSFLSLLLGPWARPLDIWCRARGVRDLSYRNQYCHSVILPRESRQLYLFRKLFLRATTSMAEQPPFSNPGRCEARRNSLAFTAEYASVPGQSR